MVVWRVQRQEPCEKLPVVGPGSVARMADWIVCASHDRASARTLVVHRQPERLGMVGRNARINSNLIFISGFSAGAYACSELLALGLDFPVAAMVFGGVHGHGNTPEICATQQLGQLAKLRIPEFNGKWQAYLRRLSLPATSE
eukprot:4918048-Amphidinium_carterae.1